MNETNLAVTSKWKRKVAGWLDIVSGCLMGMIGVFASGCSLGEGIIPQSPQTNSEYGAYVVVLVFGVCILIAGIVAVKGGINTLDGRKWGWAVAGSICAIFIGLGIPATVLIFLSKKEFK